MNEIKKFLKKLQEKERALLIKQILPQILSGDWERLDLKKLQAKPNFYRVRQGRIRIIFSKQGTKIEFFKIAFRKDIY